MMLKISLNGGYVFLSSRAQSVHLGSLVNVASSSEINYVAALHTLADQYIDLYIVKSDEGWYDNLDGND